MAAITPLPSSKKPTRPKIQLTAQSQPELALRIPSQDDIPQPWWKEAVVYQIYVPSFKDTDKDGYGDLRGVIEKLDYLVQMGVDVVWLSPIFESPMYDMGYDVSDYYKINPLYGTMADFDNLLSQAHNKGLKVMLDVALNHTSTENHWMKESIAAHKGADNDKKNFYMWGNPKVDDQGQRKPPNNWQSVFDGSMWKYVPEIDKYFLHVFGDQQADLNWDNPAVREALWKVLRFWLDKGVDGFRLDAINCVSKVPSWPDAPVVWPESDVQKANVMFANGPNIHAYMREMHEQVFARYPNAVAMGEMSCGITPEQGVDYISTEDGNRQLQLIIHFEHVELDCVDGDKWILRTFKLPELKAAVTKWQTKMAEVDGWDTVWMENHDQPRGLSRFCGSSRVYRELGAKLLAMWLFTLQGTVLLYQGQELGMTNPEEFSEDMIKDVETVIYWNSVDELDPGKDFDQKVESMKQAIVSKGRDTGRIPIPWTRSTSSYGGFTSRNGAEPWLPPDPNQPEACVERQLENTDSVWAFYCKMIRLRKFHKALIYGVYEIVDPDHPHIFAYTRKHRNETYLIALNFSKLEVAWQLPATLWRPSDWILLTSNHVPKSIFTREGSTELLLRPFEGKIWRRFGMEDEGYFSQPGSEEDPLV